MTRRFVGDGVGVVVGGVVEGVVGVVGVVGGMEGVGVEMGVRCCRESC